MIKGSIRLSIGKAGPQVYMAENPGEIIGWSCFIGRDSYSASAECVEPTNVLKFDRESFLSILKKYPANEALLYRRVAETLGNREIVCLSRIPTSLDLLMVAMGR